MKQARLSRAFILAGAVMAATLAAGCKSSDSDQKEKSQVEKQDIQRQANRRFSALDGRFEKLEEKSEAILSSIETVNHPINQDEVVNFRGLYSDVVMATAYGRQIIREVGSELKKYKSIKMTPDALQGCSHLMTYMGKRTINSEQMESLLEVPFLDKFNRSNREVYVARGLLYAEFGQGSFPDLNKASDYLDDYEDKIKAYEGMLAELEPEIEKSRKALAEPFLKLWDKHVTINLGIEQCSEQLKGFRQKMAGPR